MSENRIPTRDGLLAALREYDRVVEQSESESEMNTALDALVALAPHSYISDLIHSGERERTEEEAVEETLLRERLWHDGGNATLYNHIEAQLISALQNPSINRRRKNYCEKMIDHIREKMGRAKH